MRSNALADIFSKMMRFTYAYADICDVDILYKFQFISLTHSSQSHFVFLYFFWLHIDYLVQPHSTAFDENWISLKGCWFIFHTYIFFLSFFDDRWWCLYLDDHHSSLCNVCQRENILSFCYYWHRFAKRKKMQEILETLLLFCKSSSNDKWKKYFLIFLGRFSGFIFSTGLTIFQSKQPH
jgi:hypothetical protein